MPNSGIKIVEDNFVFPYTPHSYQYDTIERASKLPCVLLNDKVGTGKAIMSLYLGLYHAVKNGVEQIVVMVPPSLLNQTAAFIQSVKGLDEPKDVIIYRGTPAQRKAMPVETTPVILMSYNIFRSDFTRFQRIGLKHKLYILADELSMKSMGSTYKKLKMLMYRKLRITGADKPFHYLCGCNATALSSRDQIYNWCSVFDPSLYHSHRLFELAHVEKTDYWGKVIEWREVELMDENFSSFTVESRNVNLELPESVYTEVPYSLEKSHLALYNDVAEAEFLLLPEDLHEQAAEAYFSILQKVVLVPKEFGLDIRPPILDIIDTYLDQLVEDDSVIIYTRHVSVSQMLSEYYADRCVAYFGKVTKAEKEKGLIRFKSGEAQIMVANLTSLGVGQNLQVANHIIYAELPFRSDTLTQSCGRIARQGQKQTCFFRFPLAKGTIQREIYKRLQDNDLDLMKFNRNKKSLREFVNGC